MKLGMRPISGFMDHDYPPVVQQRILTENQYSISHNAPIPPELNEILTRKNLICSYGDKSL